MRNIDESQICNMLFFCNRFLNIHNFPMNPVVTEKSKCSDCEKIVIKVWHAFCFIPKVKDVKIDK